MENSPKIIFEKRQLKNLDGNEISGLYNLWIILNNEKELNSFTTEMLKALSDGIRKASFDNSLVSVILTGSGVKAFSVGGNVKEYANIYASRPYEYKLYMRLFIDVINSILTCEKPVINRVNGMRIGGGQELGLTCDFSIAADTALFGQAGPKHGSVPDGGSTDFLHLYIGISRAFESCTLCKPWSAHYAVSIGLINKIVPVLKSPHGFITNPLVILDKFDKWGNPSYGMLKTGDEKLEAEKIISQCTYDLSLLDKEVENLAYELAESMPLCLNKTIQSLRKKKLIEWQNNCEANASFLSLNMMTEAKIGFNAFLKNPKRKIDYLSLRKLIAEGKKWNDELSEIT